MDCIIPVMDTPVDITSAMKSENLYVELDMESSPMTAQIFLGPFLVAEVSGNKKSKLFDRTEEAVIKTIAALSKL